MYPRLPCTRSLTKSLDRFSTVCDQAGMKILLQKTRGIISLQKPVSVVATSRPKPQYAATGEDVQVICGGIHE